MGITLYNLQVVERLLTHCFVLVYPDQKSRRSIKDEAIWANEQTLGTLIKKLKERVCFDSTIESYLKQFVDDRNLFVHRLNTLITIDENYNPQYDKAGEHAIKTLIWAIYFNGIFLSAIAAWCESKGVKLEIPSEATREMKEMQNTFGHLLDKIKTKTATL